MEKTTSSAKYNINYHIVWCPKYRREILFGDQAEFLNLVLHNIAKENDWEILELKASYYVGTAGHVSEETIRRYIQEQEKGRNSSSG